MKPERLPTFKELILQEKAQAIYARLGKAYGIRKWKPRRPPLRELISTLLSHRTTSENEVAAMDRLWQNYGSWKAIRDAPVEGIEKAIHGVNWADRKAPYIKRVLQVISQERGDDFHLDVLNDLSTEEATNWLTSLPGVGVKRLHWYCFLISINRSCRLIRMSIVSANASGLSARRSRRKSPRTPATPPSTRRGRVLEFSSQHDSSWA